MANPKNSASKTHAEPSRETTRAVAQTPRAGLYGSDWPQPARFVLDLFSNVPFGIFLMVVLFVYSTIGSAGLFYPTGLNIFKAENWYIEFVRQWPMFELTEFEWFHTLFFNAVIALMCANIIVTTLRKIRLSWLNAGVWMIHTGIIMLCVGSVIYFAKKVEGDAPVIRRAVEFVWVKDGSARPVRMPALPGNSVEVPAPGGAYRFEIAEINPLWPIQSEEHKGKEVYSVSVAVTRPDGEQYVRQLLDGFPQYTEDVIPGKGRFKKLAESNGEALVDKDITMSLVVQPLDRFWIKDSWAIYARGVGVKDWSERPVRGLPRYNDYVPDVNDVWAAPGEPVRVRGLDLTIPPIEANDPLRDAQVRITGYLRYAFPQTQVLASGGASLFPVVDLDFENASAGTQRVKLAALDASMNSAAAGLVAFRWVNAEPDLERLRTSAQRRLSIVVPDPTGGGDAAPVRHEVVINPEDLQNTEAAPFRDVPGLEGKLAYRIKGAADNLAMPSPDENGSTTLWILMVEFKTLEKQFTRFVADIPGRSRDVADASAGAHGMVPPDATILTEYTPALLAPVTLVAGPAPIGLKVLLNTGGAVRETPLKVNEKVQINDQLSMTVRDWSPSGRVEERPAIAPKSQRDADIERSFLLSMVKVEVTRAGETESRWLPYHRYSFIDEGYADASMGRFAPDTFRFKDGKEVEVLFSRESMPLPQRVALHDFHITSHVGGFEPGRSGSIRDWTSVLAFENPAVPGGWEISKDMSTNDPVAHNGLWYFQSFWDAPRMPRTQGDPGSNGLNYTGVGIGNREGVYTQLAGCCISVLGMLYAFYYKPILRRRMKDRALAEAAAAGKMTGASAGSRGAAEAAVHRNGSLVSPDERAELLEEQRSVRR
ncbi:MAG: hypothetical protein ACKVZJ_15275 [Phycisphaerales bacterium]